MRKEKKVSCFYPNGALADTYDSIEQAGKAKGIDPSSVSKVLGNEVRTAGGYSWKIATRESENMVKASPAENTLHGISVKQFREKHDVMIIVRRAVKRLRKGELVHMRDFADSLDLPGGVGYKEKLMSPEFEPYRGKVSANEVWWGHQDDIAELKKDRLLK